ncbi:MAG: hypothetical protein RMJ83_09865, partial [Armatimonadota bacterium]|nr:hypothetical protein [Armatimonadota bacterium]
MRYYATRNARRGEWRVRAGILCAALVVCACSYAQWQVNDLHGIYVPNQSGSANYAWRISEGQNPYIVGQAGQGIFGFPVAYRYHLGVNPQGSPGVVISGAVAYGVNNHGWFVGRLTAGQQAMVWHPTYGARPISAPAGMRPNTAFDINDNGVIVGYAPGGFFETPGGFVSYFDPSDGSTTTFYLDQTFGNPSAGTSINNNGTAGGGVGVSIGFFAEPYIEPGGFGAAAAGWISLAGGAGNFVGAPIVPSGHGGQAALIWDISDGAIPQYAAAWAGTGSTAVPLVYIWNGVNFRYDVVALPLLPGATGGRAYGINNLGHVVGYSITPQGNRATLWWFDGTTWRAVDLTALAQGSGYAGWTLYGALDINNNMCIVGYGLDPQSRLTS